MIQIRRQDFLIQSLRNADYERGLIAQAPSELIVNPIKEQVIGNTFTLHPASATPIAIRPLGGRSGSNNAPAIITPGSSFRPGKTFDSFEWGLPFGWLGGGMALLYVGLDQETAFDWQSRRPEVLFHRVRLPIIADGGVLAANPNWPTRFPWVNATLPSGLNQGSRPLLDVLPTRTVMRLASGGLLAPATMRMYWEGGGDPDVIGTGDYTLDVDWPGLNPAPVIGGGPTIQLPAEHRLFGGDLTKLTLVDLSGTGALTGLNVDFFRFGTL